MRRRVALTSVLLAGTALLGVRAVDAGTTGPRDPSPVPTPAPVEPPKGAPSVEPRASRPAFIAAVRRAPLKVGALGGVFSPPYATGPVDYEVDVENPQTTPLDAELVVERLDASNNGGASAAELARVRVEAPAGGKVKVGYTDGLGLDRGCGPTRDRVRLEGSAASPRVVRTTPSCTFVAEVVDTSEAARREPRRGKLAVTAATIVGSPACGAPLTVRATLRNDAKERVSGALEIDGFGPKATRAFAVRAGGEAHVDVVIPSFQGQHGARPVAFDVAAEAPVAPSTWSLRVKRECALDVAFE